jgi:DNA-binding MurR/RpiR family transcriptional regulator
MVVEDHAREDSRKRFAEGTRAVPPKKRSVTRTGTTALTLSEEIRQRFDEFSRSQKDVGQYIVDHLEEAAFHTAEELARRANTSSSTVVRFAQALGFEGFPELQAAARDEYRRARENGASAAELSSPPLFPIDQTEFETALAADHSNVAETAKRIDRDEVAAAVDLISRADRILLCGTDQMAFFASYLRHLLMLLDLRAEVVASPSQEGLAKLGRVDDKTVMIGFSAGRPHPLVVRAMKLARNRRAATIAIADATLSEVAKLADHRLYYSSNSPAYVRSHAALLGVIQALAYGVYALDESAYADRIKAFRLK